MKIQFSPHMVLMRWLFPFFVTLLMMLLLDAAWLSLTAQLVYRAQLGDILIPGFRIAPAAAFYLLQALGIQIFAVSRARGFGDALLYGAGFGLFTYATYDLTNWATLKDWTLGLSLADISWGILLTALAATAGYAASRRVARMAGSGKRAKRRSAFS